MVKTISLILCAMFSVANVVMSQAISYSDPAQAYNRMLIEKNTGAYEQISNYKVIGTSYLYGEKQIGSVYAKDGSASKVYLGYDTYRQQLRLYDDSNPKLMIIKDAVSTDSFAIDPIPALGVNSRLMFINGRYALSDEKSFLQVVQRGGRFSLYKKYTCNLAYVSTNYIQSDLREFNLNYDYYYTDSATRESRKLKLNFNFLKKEFKSVKDISSFVTQDDITNNPETALILIFGELNKN